MSSTNIKNISIICNPSNKNIDGSYSTNLGRSNIDDFVAIALKSVSFRNVFYNVEATGVRKNNIFYMTLAGTPYEIEVGEGFYNVNQLIAVLSPLIQAVFDSSGIIPIPQLTSITYNSITAKVSMLVDGVGVATPLELTGANQPSINYLLGNTQNLSLDLLTPTEATFNGLVNMGGIDRVFLQSSTMGQNVGLSTTGVKGNGVALSLIRVLDVNEPFGNPVFYISPDLDAERLVYNSPINISNIDFSLTDENNNTLDLGETQLIVELVGYVTAI